MGRSIRREIRVSRSVGAALALEIAARNLAGGVVAFLVIDGEREEVHALLWGFGGADHGGQHDGFAIGGQHRTIGLTGNLAGLKGQLAAAPFEAFFVDTLNIGFFFLMRVRHIAHEAFLFGRASLIGPIAS